MKKWVVLLTTILVIFTLTACGNNASSKSNASSQGTTAKSKAKTKAKAKASSSSTSSQKSRQQALQKIQNEVKKGLLSSDKTVAIVNGTKITGKDYNKTYQSVAQQVYMTASTQGNTSSQQLAKQAKQRTLNSLVGETLILQDAKSKGYTASSTQIKNQYDKYAKQYGGASKLKSLLKKQNMTTDDLKKSISKQVVFNTYVTKQIGTPKVTDKEIQQFYSQYSKSQKNAPKLSKIKSQIKQQLMKRKQNQQIQNVINKLKKQGTVDIKI